MLIPNQIVPVKMGGRNLTHYQSLGYDVNFGDIINVPVEELTPGSHVSVKIQCDVCGKKYERKYKSYLHYHTYGIDTCNKCKSIKSKKRTKKQPPIRAVFFIFLIF